jgi:hypothetical protein
MGPGKSTYTVPVMFCFLLPPRLQLLGPAGGKRKSTNVERKTYTLIFPDPSFMLLETSVMLLENIYSTGVTHDDRHKRSSCLYSPLPTALAPR